MSDLCVSEEAAEEEVDDGADDHLKTRTPHNDVVKNNCRICRDAAAGTLI